MYTAKARAAAVVYNCKIYFFGGIKAYETVIGEVDAYDVRFDRWQVLPNMAEPKYDCVAALLGNLIYVASGTDECQQHQKSVHVFDPNRLKWRHDLRIPSMNHFHADAPAMVYNGSLYIAGQGCDHRFVENYDPANPIWRVLQYQMIQTPNHARTHVLI
ncbi:hypothetical protein Ciccas_012600 [Cichlidogyrus casuarinus]|uniref:Kelch repeat protein n=1 Tax=Cichlidogyrus casuarinus TaxID=1844966 RepID=A0ABD2PQ89_9PLAT